MKVLAVVLSLTMVLGLSAQKVPHRDGNAPSPHPTRSTAAPASSFRAAPFAVTGGFRRSTGTYAVPVYMSGYDEGSFSQPAPEPVQPVIPIMIVAGPDSGYGSSLQRQPTPIYQEPVPHSTMIEVAAEPAPAPAPSRYLVALKDHTIHNATAYWVDGSAMHYFTAGNTHNQVPLTSIDRALTIRLNRELGTDFVLPPAR
jgi:hypothetical protein